MKRFRQIREALISARELSQNNCNNYPEDYDDLTEVLEVLDAMGEALEQMASFAAVGLDPKVWEPIEKLINAWKYSCDE